MPSLSFTKKSMQYQGQVAATPQDQEFTNAWKHFFDQPQLYHLDGLHLNEMGSARLGTLLNTTAVN